MRKKKRAAVHFPSTKPKEPTGADIRVSRVPNLLSSANDRMVRNGTSAGAPKVNPTTKDERGGRIHAVLENPSMKKRKPMPSRERK
jgi:hypothetical protein